MNQSYVSKLNDEDVARIVKRDFLRSRVPMVLKELERCDRKDWARGPRTKLAILKLSAGSLKEVSRQVDVALRDPRDVWVRAESPRAMEHWPTRWDDLEEEGRQKIRDEDDKQYLEWLNAEQRPAYLEALSFERRFEKGTASAEPERHREMSARRLLLKRILTLATALLAVVACAIAVRYYRQRRDMNAVKSVVADLGGTISSIPYEPFGTEYRIQFENHRFTVSDVEQLSALKGLSERNSVFLRLVDCDVDKQAMPRLHALLPKVKVVSDVDDLKP